MIVCLVLAGGRSIRFGEEKALAHLDGQPMLAHVVRRMKPQGLALAINARPESRATQWAADQGLPCLADGPGAQGPLLGVLAGLDWARDQRATHLLTAPCDVPYLPDDLALRLSGGDGTSYAVTVQGEQPLCALWAVSDRGPLLNALASGHHPSARQVLRILGARSVAFPDPSAFANINTPADLLTHQRS